MSDRRRRRAGAITRPTFTPVAAALFSSLVAFWKMDEASGNRADSVGSSTLAVSGTSVGSNTGHLYALAAEVNGDGDYLSAADNAALSMGDIDFAIAGWFYVATDSPQGTLKIVRKPASAVLGDENFEYEISTTADREIYLIVGNGSTSVIHATTELFALDAWNFFVAWHDATANVVGIQVNGEVAETASYSSGSQDTAGALGVGGGEEASGTGLLGPLMVWKDYVPTPADRAWLYNDGTGRTLAEMEAL